MVCFECSYESEYVTSNKKSQHARTGAGRQFFYINLRTVFAFREMGKGLEAIVNCCQIMNMLRPFTQTAYDRCLDELHRSIQAEVNDSLQKVAEKNIC